MYILYELNSIQGFNTSSAVQALVSKTYVVRGKEGTLVYSHYTHCFSTDRLDQLDKIKINKKADCSLRILERRLVDGYLSNAYKPPFSAFLGKFLWCSYPLLEPIHLISTEQQRGCVSAALSFMFSRCFQAQMSPANEAPPKGNALLPLLYSF